MKKPEASTGVEALFTSVLGLQNPWEVAKVELDTCRRRIDFDVRCTARRLACPVCGLAEQGIHDRRHLSWRHLDFFQYEAWLYADVPRVSCSGCGKTSQASVPWARAGSGFTALFEAPARLAAQLVEQFLDNESALQNSHHHQSRAV